MVFGVSARLFDQVSFSANLSFYCCLAVVCSLLSRSFADTSLPTPDHLCLLEESVHQAIPNTVYLNNAILVPVLFEGPILIIGV